MGWWHSTAVSGQLLNLTTAGGSCSAKLSSGDARHPIAHFGYETLLKQQVLATHQPPPTHTHTTTYPPTHTHYAFAAILADGSVVTWGYVRSGGDSSPVRDQLKGVQHIQATVPAFAAILADGSVVTWGDADRGGDSWAVRDQLKGVQHIQATVPAFAAILADGSVVTWGDADRGGDSWAVRDQLRFV